MKITKTEQGSIFEAVCLDATKRSAYFNFKQVWKFVDSPICWGPDNGTDLIGLNQDDTYTAIQCKDKDTIDKRGIDSFLTDSNRKIIRNRYIISSGNSISANAQRAIDGQEKPCGVILGDELNAIIAAIGKQEAVVPVKIAPLPHQKTAIADVVAGLGAADRGQLLMACGTGKTFTEFWVAQTLGAQSVLCLLPSLNLISQSLREWLKIEAFDWIAVCSDETVGSDLDEDYDVVSEAPGIIATTKPEDVAEFMARPTTQRKVVFSTYHSSPVVAAANVTFDLAIADEAHRVAGKSATAFATVLTGQIQATKKLFCTATPRIVAPNAQTRAHREGVETHSMDDHSKFGEVLHRLSFGAARDQGLLSDYRIVAVAVDEQVIANDIELRRLVDWNGIHLDAKEAAGIIALQKALNQYKSRRAITFHSRVKAAAQFARKVQRLLNNVRADYVSGEMATGERARKLNMLRNLEGATASILSNARCLTEGVDVPALDVAMFNDARKNLVDIVQAVGRVMRLDPANPDKVGNIIVPVTIGPGENAEERVANSDFSGLFEVVRAMMAHDELLADEIERLRLSMGRTGRRVIGAGDLERIVIDLPIEIGDAFLEAVRLQVVLATSSSWHEWLGSLHRFIAANGRLPKNAEQFEGAKVGIWCMTQRKAYRKGTLSAERVAALEAVELWVWKADKAAIRKGQATQAATAASKAAMAHLDKRVHCVTTGETFSTFNAAHKAGVFGGDRQAANKLIRVLHQTGNWITYTDKTTGHVWRLVKEGE